MLRARLLENLAWIVQQAEMAAVDASPLLTATHEPKYGLRHVRIAVNHLIVATGHEQGRPANERRGEIGAEWHRRKRDDARARELEPNQ